MPLEGVKNIVLVLSGKGGVGKSSVTLQLALALSLQGKSVGILDIDLTGPSIPRLVGLENAKITQSPEGWIPVPVHEGLITASTSTSTSTTSAPTTTSTTATSSTSLTEDQDVTSTPTMTTTTTTVTTIEETKPKPTPKPRGSLRCISLGFLLRDRSDAVIWRGPKKTAMIRQFLTDVYWGETDYLLIDTPPGTSDEHIALAEQLLTLSSTQTGTATATSTQHIPRLAGAVLVTTPQAIATSDVRKEVNFCVKTKIPTLGVIENMAGYTCPCCGEVSNLFSSGGGEVMAQEMGVRFLGRVPVDVQFGALVEGNNHNSDNQGEELSDDDDAGEEGEKTETAALVVDERPLVERYQECWSYKRFEEFAETLIGEIEGK